MLNLDKIPTKIITSIEQINTFLPKRLLSLTCVLIFLGLALSVIHAQMKAYPLDQIVDNFYAIPLSSICLSLLATIISYIGIAFYDGLAMRYTNKSLPWHKTAFASCCAHAISTTLGAAAFTANAVRYRLYSSWDLNLKDVAMIGSVTLLASVFGAFTLMAVGFIVSAQTFEALFSIPPALSRGLGVLMIAGFSIAILWLARSPDEILVKNIAVTKPSLAIIGGQWITSMVDWIAAAAVLYFLLPAHPDLSLWTFIPIFVAAQYIGTLSGLPGGIGVFEAIFLTLIPHADLANLAAALVLYRLIYYFFPLIVSIIIMSAHQSFVALPFIKSGHKHVTNINLVLSPILFSILTFITASVMLVASAMPSFLPRIEYMARLLPEGMIELSHLFASAIGTLLLIVSIGLRRRLHNAWISAVILFPAGAIFTYLKGGDFITISLLLGLTICLISARKAFYRRGKVSRMRLTPMRFTALVSTLSLAAWSGFYAHKNQAYSQELWWNFGLQHDASRFLRACALVGAIVLIYLVWRLLHPSRAPQTPKPCDQTMAKVRDILERSTNSVSETNLALMGDKHFLFSQSGKSFIMYGIKGRNWIALGEPIGLDEERRELLFNFQETADLWGAWPCFYAIRSRNLHDFVDMGLSVQKIGEMALVPIKSYDLTGKTKARFRQAKNRAAREGVTFDVIQIDKNSPEMDRLEIVSSQWLQNHSGREKGFSLGRFDRTLLSTQPIAVAWQNGKIVAFSNLWKTPDKSELSLDLMRYTANCMTGVMDFLFAEVMIWGCAQGYEYFSLGMAPMSGLDGKNFSSPMSHLGRFIYRYGGRFYSFQGLRSFKKKFYPDWEPVYLAAPNQVSMPRALSNLALLSAGGMSGILRSN